MKTRFPATLLATLAVGLLACSVAGAAMIGIYRNGMESTTARSQMIKLFGRSCARGGAESALRVTLGKQTASCAYRTPVLGRYFEIAATERLLSGTPPSLQRKAYLGLSSAPAAAPSTSCWSSRRSARCSWPGPPPKAPNTWRSKRTCRRCRARNKANVLRRRAINATSGTEKGQAKLLGYVGSSLVVEASDESAGELSGRASAVSVGATKGGDGLIASVDDVVVRIPSPF